MNTKTQENKRNYAIRRIIEALKDGRRLDIYDSWEFGVSEMHTCFCIIRQKIRDGKITGYVMKDEWHTNAEGIRYKIYWFEDGQN